jgi:hypothetical protein
MCAIISVLAFVTGCEQNTEELIVGKWQFDHITYKEGTAYTPADSLQLLEKTLAIKQRGLAFQFNADKTCTISSQSDSRSGTYSLQDENQTLMIEVDGDASQTSKLVSINKNELVLNFEDSNMDDELVHLKKVE